MLFATPPPQRVELDVVARIEEIRAQVHFLSAGPRQWVGLLAPLFLPPSADGSTADAVTEDPLPDPASADPRHTHERAAAGYGEAMQYILQLHDDPHFVYQEGFVRSVHFMMLAYDVHKNPGRWRSTPICVHRRHTNEILYEAPPADLVPELMRELMARLNHKDETPVVVRAAMAHLNLAKIHPFADGNGRLARALHTLVMVREGILDPEFCSIEGAIARARGRYFESLSDVGSVTWSPEGDARPFLRFCLTAHLQQAERVLGQARRMGQVWAEAQREIQTRRLPDRLAFALADAAFLGEIGARSYRQWAGGSEARVRQDLKTLADHGLLIRSGGRRGVAYTPGPRAHEIRQRAWADHPEEATLDPFENEGSAG